MTNQPKTEIDGTLLAAAGHWRSVTGNAWLVVRSGHGLASEVTSLSPTLSGSVDVDLDAESCVVCLDVDLGRLSAGCSSCQTRHATSEATLTLESAGGPATMCGWALAGTFTGHAATTAVDAQLDIRVEQRVGESTEARFIVRTQVPVAALGLCDTHRLGPTELGARAELLTHLLATRDAKS